MNPLLGRHDNMRKSGLLCHLTSLPNDKARGGLGQHAMRFLDLLQSAGQSAWQMLPIHPPDQYDSPYASTSAFAGDITLLDKEIATRVFAHGGLMEFRLQNPWVHDWALYQIAKQLNDWAPWSQWDEPLRNRKRAALESLKAENIHEYWRHIGEQLAFAKQWDELRTAAEERGIELIGDLPFFIAYDSADVWANQNLFQLNEDGEPTHVSGVPPDAFSDQGQFWGTPLYNWNAHQSGGFAWWRARIATSLGRFHRLRIDHFRAIHDYWSIPASSESAADGAWVAGPRDELLDALKDVAGEGRLIAEDLGIIPPEVIELRQRHEMQGMAVLQFAFDGNSDNPHLPTNIAEDVICYSGTHDNNTTVGWFSNLNQEGRDQVANTLDDEIIIDKNDRPIHRRLMRSALFSRAQTTIIPLQDVMGLESSARMNTPGSKIGNWLWQFEWDDIEPNDFSWLANKTIESGRSIINEAKDSKSGANMIAYFSAEIGLRSDLPTYSGGLGVLAGDHIKAAADKGLNFIAVTLLYRHGYGRQHLDEKGKQTETFPAFDPRTILDDTGIDIAIPLDGRSLISRIWKYTIKSEFGNEIDVLFLDTMHPDNDSIHSSLGERLYGGGDETRIRQEYLLGVGGVRALKALGRWPLQGIHMNEGHCAFAALEMLSQGWSREELSQRSLFTTHTPVPAGHDYFAWEDVEAILGELLPIEVRNYLGGNACSMSHLAAYFAGQVNAVSILNAQVAAGMFPECQVHPITNGVHHLTWVGPPMQELFDVHLPEWRKDPAKLVDNHLAPDDALMAARNTSRTILHDLVKVCTGVEFESNALTIGFARRFATYKRADLVFRNLKRLERIGAGKIQFVFAGKAHPRDEGGKQLISNVFEAATELQGKIPVAFLEDYSMETGRVMTNGVDIWLNNPVRPMEASGTSGMKASMSGVPNCSILDGWWPEACAHGINGWAIGNDEMDRDDERDGEAILDVLEHEVIPLWEAGAEKWLPIVRGAITAGSKFSAARMLDDYGEFYTRFGKE